MPIGSEILIFQDPADAGTWRVEYFDHKSDCYLTRFSGPAAERRARDYVLALSDGMIGRCELVSRTNRRSPLRRRAQLLQSGALDQRRPARCRHALCWQRSRTSAQHFHNRDQASAPSAVDDPPALAGVVEMAEVNLPRRAICSKRVCRSLRATVQFTVFGELSGPPMITA